MDSYTRAIAPREWDKKAMGKSTTVRNLRDAASDGPIALLTAYVDLENDPQGDPQFKLVVPTGTEHFLAVLLGERANEQGVFHWRGLLFKQLPQRDNFRWMIYTTRNDPSSIELLDQLMGEEMAAIRLTVLQAAIRCATSERRKSSDPSGDFTQQLRLPADYFSALLTRLKEHLSEERQPALAGSEG